MAARISLRVKSGCLATRVKSHSECSSSGEVLPPLGLASTLPVSLQRRHHRITELTPTSNTSATSRRDAPLSTASTARSRKSVEYGFGIDLAPRRINFSRFAWTKAVGNPPDSMPPRNALAEATRSCPTLALVAVSFYPASLNRRAADDKKGRQTNKQRYLAPASRALPKFCLMAPARTRWKRRLRLR